MLITALDERSIPANCQVFFSFFFRNKLTKSCIFQLFVSKTNLKRYVTLHQVSTNDEKYNKFRSETISVTYSRIHNQYQLIGKRDEDTHYKYFFLVTFPGFSFFFLVFSFLFYSVNSYYISSYSIIISITVR